MGVAALARIVAAPLFSIALFFSDQCTVDEVLRPFGGLFNPLDDVMDMVFPIRIEFRMEQDITGKLKWDYLVHVVHAGYGVFKVAHPRIRASGYF